MFYHIVYKRFVENGRLLPWKHNTYISSIFDNFICKGEIIFVNVSHCYCLLIALVLLVLLQGIDKQNLQPYLPEFLVLLAVNSLLYQMVPHPTVD